MKTRLHILLVDDDEDEYVLLKGLVYQQEQPRYDIDWASSAQEAMQASQSKSYDVYLVDYYLGSQTGLDLMRAWAERDDHTPVILLTGQDSYEIDLAAMQLGAFDFIPKAQLTAPLLERSIRYTLEQHRARDELELRVQERTRELAQANEDLKMQIEVRKQFERALAESEMRLRALTETTSAAIFIVQENQIRYANPAARFITGFNPEELVGKPFWQLAHPDYQTALMNGRLTNHWIKAIPTRFELKIVTRAGEERWLDITAGDMDYEGAPASIVTAFDITERDMAEKALKQAKEELEVRVRERTQELRQAMEQLRTVLETLPVAIWIAEADGSMVSTNRMVEKIWGKGVPNANSIPELDAYRGWWAGSGMPVKAEEWALARALTLGETSLGEIIDIQRFDGTSGTILNSAAPILDAEGRITGAVAVSQDITDQRRLERELQKAKARAEMLSGLSRTFAQAGLEYPTVLNTIAAQITEQQGDGVIIRLVTSSGDELEPVAVYFKNPRAQEQLTNPPGLLRESMITGIAGEVARTGKPVVLFDSQSDEIRSLLRPEIATALEELSLISMIVMPLRVHDNVIGTLTVVRARPNPPFAQEDLVFFQDLADRAALAIENARLHAQVKQQAARDALTGQYNRRAFFEIGRSEMDNHLRGGQPLAAIMLDIDFFKTINDRYGHALGDEVLRKVIDHCRENIRHTDILGRYGGDEYAILLPHTDLETALAVAGRIRESIASAPFVTNAGPITVSISAGVAQAGSGMFDIHALLAQADRALYQAKRSGRNRVVTG